MKLRLTLVVLLAQLALQTAPAQTGKAEHWVATWGTAELLVHPRPPATPPARQAPGAAGFHNQTVRMVVRTSMGGSRLRIKVENAFGSAPVEIGAAHIALRAKDSEIVADRTAPHLQRQAGLHAQPRRGMAKRSRGSESPAA